MSAGNGSAPQPMTFSDDELKELFAFIQERVPLEQRQRFLSEFVQWLTPNVTDHCHTVLNRMRRHEESDRAIEAGIAEAKDNPDPRVVEIERMAKELDERVLALCKEIAEPLERGSANSAAHG